MIADLTMVHLDNPRTKHHDVIVRTTITLEPDVAEKLQELSRARKASFKETVNQVLRRGLAAQQLAAHDSPFQVEPHAGGFRPGVDPAKLNQLVGQIDVADFIAETRRASER